MKRGALNSACQGAHVALMPPLPADPAVTDNAIRAVVFSSPAWATAPGQLPAGWPYENRDGQPAGFLESDMDEERTGLAKAFVSKFQQIMSDQADAAADLRLTAEEALEAKFSKREVSAMKKIARVQLKDARLKTAYDNHALEEIGRAVGCDVFNLT